MTAEQAAQIIEHLDTIEFLLWGLLGLVSTVVVIMPVTTIRRG
jgi:hypothetical protein